MPYWRKRERPPINEEEIAGVKAALVAEVKKRWENKETIDGIPRFFVIVLDVLRDFENEGKLLKEDLTSTQAEERHNLFRDFLLNCPELQAIHEESNRLLAERQAAAQEEEEEKKKPKKKIPAGYTDPDDYTPDKQTLRDIEAAKLMELQDRRRLTGEFDTDEETIH